MTPEYYQANKEKIKAQIKTYYLANKEEKLQYQREYRKLNRAKLTERDKNKRKDRLEKAIKILGNKCAKCKSTFDSCVYDFHHLNPDEKKFTISENMLVSEKKFFEEVNKCILLCANCHRLTHKEINLASK